MKKRTSKHKKCAYDFCFFKIAFSYVNYGLIRLVYARSDFIEMASPALCFKDKARNQVSNLNLMSRIH